MLTVVLLSLFVQAQDRVLSLKATVASSLAQRIQDALSPEGDQSDFPRVDKLNRNHMAMDILRIFNDPTKGLAYCVKNNIIEYIHDLCLLGADVNKPFVTQENEYILPLQYAVKEGFVDLARLLLEHGADVNKDMLDYQREHGVTLNTSRAGNYKPLRLGQSNISMLMLFYEHGLFDSVDKVEIWKILNNAVESNRHDLVEWILQTLTVDLNAIKPDVPTPLCTAIFMSDSTMVKLLLDHGASVNVQDNSWEDEIPAAYPLGYAVMEGEHDIIKLLIDRGAHLNQRQNNDNDNLFDLILRSVYLQERDEETIAIWQLLKSYGISYDTQTYSTTTEQKPLGFVTRWSGNVNRINFLLSEGFPIDADEDSEGNSALGLAIQGFLDENMRFDNHATNTIERLLDAGANIDRPNRNGVTPRMFVESLPTTNKHRTYLLSLLTTYKHIQELCHSQATIPDLVQVYYEEWQDMSPLQFAVEGGCIHLARKLLEYGAKITHDIVHTAVTNGDIPMLNLFYERGAFNTMSIDTIVVEAIDCNQCAVVQWLLDRFAIDVNGYYSHPDTNDTVTPLARAVGRDTAMVKLLLQNSSVDLYKRPIPRTDNLFDLLIRTSDVDQRRIITTWQVLKAHGLTYSSMPFHNELLPLGYAAYNHYDRVVEFLLSEGFTIDTNEDSEGTSALGLALKGILDTDDHNFKITIQKLLDAGASIHRPNNEGITPHMLVEALPETHTWRSYLQNLFDKQGSKRDTSLDRKEDGTSKRVKGSE